MEDDLENFIYRPLAWAIRISGISPFKIKLDNHLPVAISCNIKARSNSVVLAITLAGSASVYYILNIGIYPFGAAVKTQGILFAVWSIAWLLAPIAFLIQSYLRHDFYIAIWKDILELNRQLEVRNQMRMQKAMTIFVLIQYLGNQILLGMVTESFKVKVAVMIIDFEFLVPQLQHLVLIHLTECGLSTVNGHLKHLKDNPVDSPVALRSRMSDILQWHSRFHGVIMKINSHFGVYNIANVICKVVISVNLMHGIFHSIRLHQEISILVNVLLSFNMLMLLIIVVFSHACSKEASRTVLIAHSMVKSFASTTPQIMEQVEQFSLVALGSQVRISVGGVANLDNTFIIKCAAASMTYLLITLQIENV